MKRCPHALVSTSLGPDKLLLTVNKSKPLEITFVDFLLNVDKNLMNVMTRFAQEVMKKQDQARPSMEKDDTMQTYHEEKSTHQTSACKRTYK